jgi:ABC-2 type transport system permease protein
MRFSSPLASDVSNRPYCLAERILQFWGYTLAPPMIMTCLYFVIFGKVVGQRIGQIDGIDYLQYIAPGLILLCAIVQSYSHTAAGWVGARLFRYIEELLVSPLPDWMVMLGYVASGAIRGLVVSLGVLMITLLFTRLHIHSLAASSAVLVLSVWMSSLAGFISALFADSFDRVYGVQNYVLIPLLYVGGVFGSVSMQPAWAQSLSRVNPFFYGVNAFRYGLLGVSDVPFHTSVSLIAGLSLILFGAATVLMRHGMGLRH